MTQPYLEAAAREFGLSAREIAFLTERGVRSHDALHEALEGAPGLAEAAPDIRRDLLIARVTPLLSPGYRAALAQVLEPPLPGAELSEPVGLPVPENLLRPLPPPADWPGLTGPPVLREAGDQPLDLRARMEGVSWPVRDQGPGTATCVPYAAAACLELMWREPGTLPETLAPEFLYAVIAGQGGLGRNGGTKLGQVRKVLLASGICAEEEWPRDAEPTQRPPARLMQKAAPRAKRIGAISYWDLGLLRRRWPGAARTVLELLKAGRPVAISIPEHRDPLGAKRGPTDWWRPIPVARGEVRDPVKGAPRPKVGHAVCIVGFQPDPNETLGGWFIFRNSLGQRWSKYAPVQGDETLPVVPEQGYGALSASHLERYVYEIFSPSLP